MCVIFITHLDSNLKFNLFTNLQHLLEKTILKISSGEYLSILFDLYFKLYFRIVLLSMDEEEQAKSRQEKSNSLVMEASQNNTRLLTVNTTSPIGEQVSSDGTTGQKI